MDYHQIEIRTPPGDEDDRAINCSAVGPTEPTGVQQTLRSGTT
jgi:hypothetical protein